MSRRPTTVVACSLLLLSLLPLPALAAAVRWNNAAGGNWNVAANWSPAAVPTASDTAVIDLAGTYTVTVNQNLALAGLRVNGSASGTQTVTAVSRTMAFSGPVTLGAQSISNWTSCTVSGAGAIVSEGTLNLGTSSIAQALTSAGTLVVTGSSVQTGALATTSGSLIRVLGNASSNGQLTVANGFTNNATIELTSTGAATAATLAVTNGSLTNAPGAQINSLAGSGGGRSLNAQYDNQGTITVSQNLTTSRGSSDILNSGTINVTGANYTIVLSGTTPTFTTSGTVNVAATRTLTLQGGIAGGAGMNFIYSGGTLGGAGTVALLNSTLNLNVGLASSMAHLDGSTSIVAGPATLTVSAGTTVPMGSCTISAPTVVEAGGTLEMTASDMTGTLSNSGTTVWMNVCTAPGAITTVGGSTLRVLGNASANGSLTVSNGFTNNATIELTSSGAATAATLAVTTGALVNAPGAQINSLAGSGGGRNLNAQLDNQGTITVSQNTTTNKISVDHVNSGTINVTGANYTIVLSSTTPTFTTSGTINVAATRTLTLQGGIAGGAGMNFIYNGGTLGGAGTVALLNSTLNLNVGLASSMAHLDGSTSIVAGPATLTVSAGTTVPMGSCTISAPTVVEAGGTLEMTASDMTGPLTSSGTTVWMNACTAPGAITTVGGSTLRVLGNASANGSLTVSNGFTNNATIELTSSGAATAATLAVTTGALVNAPGAQINSLAGSGGGRNLNAQLDNQGTITVSQNTTTNKGSVDHVNPGTINVTGGNYTVLLSGTTPTFTTTGAINVAATRTLTLQGNVAGGAGLNFIYNGGTLGGAGTVALLNSTLNLNVGLASSMAHLDGSTSIVAGPATLTVSAGTTVPMGSCTISAPTVVEAGGTLEMTASDMTGTLTSSGTTVWMNACTAPGAITTVGGSTLRVLGNASANGSLTVSNGFTNNATIELTSSGAATAATLAVTTGALVNAPGAQINSLAGSGGGRNLNAQLDNQGTITVSQNTTTNKGSVDHVNPGTINVTGGNYTILLSGTTPTFTTTGAINVAATRTLTLQGNVAGGAGLNFIYNGGTLGGAGTVALLNSTLNLNVGLASSMAHLDGSTSIVAGPATLTVSAGTTVPMGSCTISAPTVVEAGGTLEMTASDMTGTLSNSGTTVWMNACTAPGAITTVGGSTLRVLGNASANGSLTVSNGFTNNATIELTSSGAATAATLAVTTGTLVNAPGAQINSLAGSGGSRFLTAQYDNQGTITVSQVTSTSKGSVDIVNSGTINVAGGNYTILLSGTTPTFTTTGAINVAATRTLTLQGNIAGGAGLDYFLNGGTLGGAGTLALLNSTLHLNQPLATSAVILTGSGAILTGPDTLRVDGGGPSLTNCTMNGPVVCSGGALTASGCDWNALLDMRPGGTLEWRGVSTFAGTFLSASGSTTRLMGTAGANSTLTSSVTMQNNGLLELGTAGATAAILSLNGTFTNGPSGTLRVLANAGGARQMLCGLDNQGLLEVQQSLLLSRAATAHANSGTVRVSATKTLSVSGASFTNAPAGVLAGDGTITMSGATAMVQSGTVRPGASPGRLAFTTTSWPCAATSVVDVEVGGDAPATGYDQVAISGAATLAGTLNVSLVNGFLPTPGRRYVIATFASRTGTFAAVNGLEYGPGQVWAVAYSDTDVVLLAMDQTWTRVFPTGTPPLARDGHTAVLDPAGDRMIVFGGRTDTGTRNDVWVLTHATSGGPSQWIALSPSGGPPAARTNASAVYDAATNRMIVHGGDDGAATPAPLGDTWVLTNANGLGGAPAWTALAPASPPAARSAHGAAYDPATNRMMLFGGSTTPGACGGALADAWVLENANGLGGAPAWTALAPSGTPPSGRQFAGVAWDAASSRLLVTGGDNGCGVANTESWVLDGANGVSGPAAWTALAPAQLAPGGWSLARYAYDDVYQWVDGFGGVLGGGYVDTSYTLVSAAGGGGESWHRRAFWGTRPPARALHGMVVSSANHIAVVFAGLTAAGRANDVYRRDIDRGAVLDVDPPVTPPSALPRVTAFAMPPSPNPARGDVSFAVDVARDQRVELDVFDLAGRRVASLHSGLLEAGRHAFRWSGAGDQGAAAPGVYLVRLHAEERTQVVRAVRIR